MSVVELLGKAFEAYERASGLRAVLVGGAVVSLLTDGAYLSGDFDVLAASNDALDLALNENGFRRVTPGGRLRWVNPAYPTYLVESVSGPYFDGLADRSRIAVVTFGPGSRLNMAPIEDMIADRLGQYASATNDPGPLNQAKLLYRLGAPLDMDYLTKRVADEQGDLAALLTEGWAR